MVSGTERAKRAGRRRVAHKEPRRVIRVHAEGEVTEPEYLKLMKGREVRIDFGPSGFDPGSLVRHARNDHKGRSAAGDFDEVWCVFDRDQHPHIENAIDEARAVGVEVAVSNPCVEVWLILHVEDRTAYIDRKEAQNRCTELGLTDGKSIRDTGATRLRDGYDEAKGRAQALRYSHLQHGDPSWANPSSGLWRLVDRLR
ncbi:MAG: RloB domain-containing protein [Gammaproteobacteria bacterium]|nr:RloB domain-containing protein [Gammaproteobacteria bacterium]MYE84531.1 RloB domain-containing protein [Gammaproteobacteria bacterium]